MLNYNRPLIHELVRHLSYMTRQKQARSKLVIYVEVLNVINSGIRKPTIIMSRSNLSWTHLSKILISMIEQGLIIEIPNELSKGKQYREDKRTKRTYEITERGINIVRYFRDGKKMTNFNMLDIY